MAVTGYEMKGKDSFPESMSKYILYFIVALGAGLRFYGIAYGFPFVLDADEPLFVKNAVAMLASHDLNPHWFGHPGSTVIYMLAACFAVLYSLGYLFNFFPHTTISDLYFGNTFYFYFFGRILMVVFSVGLIIMLYKFSRKIVRVGPALLATFLLALNPLHVEFSQIVRSDIVMSFLVLISMIFALRIITSPKSSDYVLAGLFTGFAIATKYPAATLIPILILAHFLRVRRSGPEPLRLIIMVGMIIVGMFIASPYMFLNYPSVIIALTDESRSVHLSATGQGFFRNLIWYIQKPLVGNLGLAGIAFAGVSIIASILSRNAVRRIIVIFPLFYLVFISSLHLRWERWIIPVIPFFCLFISEGFFFVMKKISDVPNIRKLVPFIAVVLLFFLVAAPVQKDIRHLREVSHPDTRVPAFQWIEKNIPLKSSLLMEKYTPQLPRNHFDILFVSESGQLVRINQQQVRYRYIDLPYCHIGDLKDVTMIFTAGVDYVILSDWYRRYRADNLPQYQRTISMYQKILSHCKKVKEFRPVPGVTSGRDVLIYKVCSP